MRRVLRRGRGEQGQALVEMALVFPLMFVLLLAIVQFGIVYNKYITLTDAVRSGARQLSLERGVNDPCDPAINAAVTAGGSISLTTAQVNVTWVSGTSDTCGSGSKGSYTGGTEVQGDAGTLTATAPFSINIMGIVVYSGNLSSSATDAIE